MLDAGRVSLRNVTDPDPSQGGRRETRAAAVVEDDVAYEVSVAVDGNGRLRFGRCGCQFFQNNLMSRGPCAHILAARLALDARGIPVPDWPRSLK